MKKVCKRCEIEKDIDYFRIKGFDNKYMYLCKPCEKLSKAEAYQLKQNLIKREPVCDLDEEIWKDIEGFEGYYKVSDMGRIKGVERYLTKVDGNTQIMREQLLKPSRKKQGYLQVTLAKETKFTYNLVHIIVANHFVPNPFNLPEVNHLFGVKDDNRATQLGWSTHQDNCIHRSRVLGLTRKLKCIEILFPNGTTEKVFGIANLKEKYGFRYQSILPVLNGVKDQYKGHSFIYV